MEITEVKVFLVSEEKLKAFVSIVIDRCFMINDIKVIQGREGLFISMPSRRKKNGEFKDVAHPLNNETRRWMEDHILTEYEQALADKGGDTGEAVAHRVLGEKSAATEAPAPAPVAAEAERPAAAQAEGPAASQAEGPAAEEAPKGSDPDESGKTLEEVQEQHLSDSFWSVTGG